MPRSRLLRMRVLPAIATMSSGSTAETVADALIAEAPHFQGAHRTRSPDRENRRACCRRDRGALGSVVPSGR